MFTINIAPGPVGPSTVDYVIATASSSISGFAADKFQFTGTGFVGTPSVLLNGNNLVLRFQPVPEPVHALLACAGVAGVAGWLRRRRAAGRTL
jgi:hypothetical protein